jgi:AcrR family transcriptional regulator
VSTKRAPNRRGQGTRLRDEILEAARVLAEAKGEQAVTLRAVAREVGIAAPSIYAHFPDREAILSALVDEAFDELSAVVLGAMDAATGPVGRLRAACDSYVDFALRRPNRYQLAFAPRTANEMPRASATRAFELLVHAVRDCIDAGDTTSADAFGNATAIWVALHGYATMRSSRPAFPWPEGTATVDRIVEALAGLTAHALEPTRDESDGA